MLPARKKIANNIWREIWSAQKIYAGDAELGSKLMFLATNQRQIKKRTDI